MLITTSLSKTTLIRFTSVFKISRNRMKVLSSFKKSVVELNRYSKCLWNWYSI